MLFCKWRKARLVTVSILMAGLAACATGPQTELGEGVASRIRTIALLDIAEPPVDQILNRGRSNESHSSTYAQALTDAQVEFSPLLAEAITRQLERSHYRVMSLPTQRPVIGADGQVDLSSIRTDADAILAVRFKGAGYASPSTTSLQPWAIVDVQLFDARTQRTLYSKTFNGGDDLGIDGAIHLAANARYQYASPDELNAKLDDSADGIKDAELAIAGAIGQDFAIGSRPVAGYAEPQRPPVAAPEKTAAERDREAATALAAQWAAAAPPPAPAPVVDAAATAPDDGMASAEPEAGLPSASATPAVDAADRPQAPPPVIAAAPAEPAEPAEPTEPAAPPELAPRTDDAVSAAPPPQVPPAAADTMPIVATEPTAPPAPIPAPSPAAVAAPAPAVGDVAAESGNDVREDVRQAPVPVTAPAPEPSVPAPPPAQSQTPSPVPPPVPAAARNAAAAPGLVLKQRTPVRVSPTSRADVFAILPAGTSFTRSARVIQNASGTWCFIKAGAITGWVPIAITGP